MQPGFVLIPPAPSVTPGMLLSGTSAALLLVLALAGALFFLTLAVIDILREVEDRHRG